MVNPNSNVGRTQVRVRLVAMAEALEQRPDALVATSESDADEVFDEVDRAQHISEVRLAVALQSALFEERAEIAHAIEVLDAGGYGLCQDCGDTINPVRLAGRPESTRCLVCQVTADFHGR
jgi:DnaK suppressor protein